MKELSSAQIRQMYLDFFKSKGHDVMKSAPLIPHDDPTLLWINSGVATMKKYFDGSVVPKNHRITSSQKSIRTNDIENVGHTARHHTLFEMLGSFSVGDYFKKEAITWAWELLTSPEWFDMDKEKLYITVYPEDKDAKKYWEEVGVDPSHIYEAEDNFWDIGEGPSGPDSEIFFDRGQEMNNLPEDDPESYPGGENERYLEIWNIVFSEFNHKPDGTYEPLPHKNIDTGMGLERVVSVFQHARTNFETDLFLPIIEKTAELSVVKMQKQMFPLKLLQIMHVQLHSLLVTVLCLQMKVEDMLFVVLSDVQLCMVKSLELMKHSFISWFQLLEKSWNLHIQKC